MTPEQERMTKIVDEFQRYVADYTKQQQYEDYRDDTFLEDMLYGLGVALDRDEYGMASGYREFKKTVLQRLVNIRDLSTTTLESK